MSDKQQSLDTRGTRPAFFSDCDLDALMTALLETMSQSLSNGERIEIRGFGSFSLHFRPPRMGRNPKSGAAVVLRGKYVPHFKPGKELRERVNTLPLDLENES